MSQSNTTPGGDRPEFDVIEFARQTVKSVEYGDAMASVLERRVIRIEEVIAARWPRSWVLRRRLAREIRASTAGWDPEYIPRGDFHGRRLAAVAQEADDLFARQERASERGWPEPGEGLLP